MSIDLLKFNLKSDKELHVRKSISTFRPIKSPSKTKGTEKSSQKLNYRTKKFNFTEDSDEDFSGSEYRTSPKKKSALDIRKENEEKVKKIKDLDTMDYGTQNDFFQNENLLINVAIDKIRRKWLTFANEDGVFEIDVTNDLRLASYFEENLKSQEYFKEIVRIKKML
eukprot:CAMPEP_0170532132 /NCGR_PEP_ID=MMETSP0209-20121228/68772_1 /TAXON_ID=665100 ORGANISM="Litonotus pictus, Strain P1" /NCGR_SAMPLE_ID=MMETSP0209 /ASSEMBLY_ACC=CAM_ASM_000301 /LENGTH=166 /DNA_ID=CAMNT_0010827807 /DNA_START=245 /DNA_END=742 /DNA_ORIENTATION=+